MKTALLDNGDMIVLIPKSEKENQLLHLYSLTPTEEDDKKIIKIMINKVEGKPNLYFIKGGKNG